MAAHRTPYVGTGADGARRSARMDRAQADSLDPSDPRRAALLDSAARWDDQAADLDQAADRADDRARRWRDMAAEVQAAREHEQEHQWYIDRHQGWGRDEERGHGRER